MSQLFTLASTSVPFRPTKVQLPNLALIDTKNGLQCNRADLCYLDDSGRGHEVDAWADGLQSVPDVARFLLPLELLKMYNYYA